MERPSQLHCTAPLQLGVPLGSVNGPLDCVKHCLLFLRMTLHAVQAVNGRSAAPAHNDTPNPMNRNMHVPKHRLVQQ